MIVKTIPLLLTLWLGLLPFSPAELLASNTPEDYLVNIRHINIGDGLSHRRVYSMIQDQNNYMWVGTANGLNRYDGYDFQVWTRAANGLSFDAIHHIVEDHQGLLWLINQRKHHIDQIKEVLQIDIFDPITGAHRSIEEHFGEAFPVDYRKLEHIFVTRGRHILLKSTEGCWEYLPERGFVKVEVPPSTTVIGYHHPRILILKNEDGLTEVNLDTQQRQRSYTQMKEIYRTIEFYAKEYLLIGHQVGEAWRDESIVRSNNQQQGTPFYPLASVINANRFFVAFEPQQKHIWVAKGRHFAIYNKEEQLLYAFEDGGVDELIEREIRSFLVDHNSIGWVGTSNGLYLIELQENLFHRYLYQHPDSVRSQELVSCRGLLVQDDFLYANTYRGKKKIDLRSGQTTTMGRSSPYHLSPPNPFPVIEARQGHLWMGINQGKLAAHDPVSDREVAMSLPVNLDIPGTRVWSIFEEEDGRIWLGTGRGPYTLEGETFATQVAARFSQYNGFSALGESFVLQIFPDNANELMLATSTGLYVIDKKQGVKARYWSGAEGAYHLPAEKFQHIYKDEEGIYWLATDGAGLIRWDRQNQQWQKFAQEQGLSNNNIYAVYEDNYNALWMSTDYGINRLHKRTYAVHIFLEEDGISHYEFNRISHYQSAVDGHIYFGGMNGITAFDPADFAYLNEKRVDQKIQLTAFTKRTWNRAKVTDDWAKITEEKQIRLQHNERELHFKFSLSDYFYSDRIRYYYKLTPRDEHWTALQGNELHTHNLTPGKYTLRVKARSAEGQFVDRELTLPLYIARPLFHQPWFIGFVLCFLAFGIWRIYEWRLSIMRKQQQALEIEVSRRTAKIAQQSEQLLKDKYTIEQQAEELKELDKAKSRFFANVSHELRTPLSLILGPINRILRRNQLEREDRRLLQLMQQNGGQLMQRIDELLDLSRMEADKLPLKESPQLVYPLMREQVANFRSFALQQKIRLSFDYKAAADLRVMLDENKFKKIFGNLLSNALKFTPGGGTVRIRLSDLGSKLRLCVEDNGSGIHPDDLPHIFGRFYQARHNSNGMGGTGIGLSLSRELARIMKGEITVESTYGEGSKFCFEFPKEEIIVDIDENVNLEPVYASAVEVSPEVTAKNAPTILLVEDNHALREYLRTELKDYNVLMAANGQAALELLKVPQPAALAAAPLDEGPDQPAPAPRLPDLILSDIMMPVMDGFELLHQLKSNERWQTIPVVMLTARSDQADKLTALRIGVDDYLVKPFDTNELVVRINNLLERARLRQPSKEEEETPEGPAIGKEAQQWLKKVETIVLEQLHHSDFNLEKLAAELFISKRQLQRRLKAATGLTAHNYLREIKLHQARRIIEQGECETLAELSYAVGFTDPHYFSTLYQKRFGSKPMA